MTESNFGTKKQTISIVTLLVTTGLMWFGFFMLIPLLAVHITDDLGLGAAIAGFVLAVRQFTQFGLGLFVAALADWAGYRRMIMLGMLVRALGFFWLAFASDVLTLSLSAALAAVGGAFFESSSKAAIVALSKGYKRETIFSLLTTIGNIGMSTGPIAGVALLKVDFSVVGMVAASMYLINFLLVWIFVPVVASTGNGKGGVSQMFSNLGVVWNNKPFVLITVLMVGYYSLYSQINITLPLKAEKLTGNEESVGLLYVINSGLAITLQILCMRYLTRWFKPVTVIGVGTLVAGLGLLLVSFVSSYLLLLVCLVVYALGRLVVEPMSAVLVSNYATEQTMASYFGFNSLALGFGGVFGSFLGGWMFDFGPQHGLDNLCWWFFGFLGVLVAVGVVIFQRSEKRRANLVISTGMESVVAASPDAD
ncbi:MAG TPA: MFS transporter [Chloroflexia bacterium]|nr:MFS transporter [Chloroflexia bacterium]